MAISLPASLTPRLGLLGLALPLLVAACDSAPTAPAAAAPQLREGIGAGAPGHLRSNRVRYSDSARPRATGRSGTATLTGYAVAGNGGTALTLVSGGVADPGSGRGEIVKAQVKAFTPDGRHLFTLNFQKLRRGTVTLELPLLPAGAALSVQANVRGIDGRRTDVVELTDEVRAAPRLAASLSLPPQTVAGAPAVITGTVSETGGDVGVRADCVLEVEGVEVDRASGIWVDAGDDVECAFTYAFGSAGEYDVELVVVPLPDASYPTPDGASASGTLTAVPAVMAGPWSASAEDRWSTRESVYEYSWADGAEHKEYSKTEAWTTRSQQVAVSGTAARPLGFPISLDLELRSGGILKHEEHWTEMTGTLTPEGALCLSRTIVEQGSALLVCTTGTGGSAVTSYSYRRFAQRITYRSHGFSNYFDGQLQHSSTWDDSYTVNGEGGQPWQWGADLHFRLVLGDGIGALVINPALTLAAFTEDLGAAERNCTEKPWGDRGWVTLRECWSTRDEAHGVRGSGSGQG